MLDHVRECSKNKKNYYCKNCFAHINVYDLDEKNKLLNLHFESCPKIKIICMFCKLEINREDDFNHKNICIYRNIHCENCKSNIIYKDLEKHQKKECYEIIKKSYEDIINEKNKQIENMKKEIFLLKTQVNIFIYLFRIKKMKLL